MKLLLINDFISAVGGAERSLLSEARLLRRHGHEVAFFGANKKPLYDEFVEYATFFPECVDLDRPL